MVDLHGASSTALPLHLDLRGKTLVEVAEILKQSGYRISDTYQEKAFGQPNIFNWNPTTEDMEGVVWCIEINRRDSPNLTIVPSSGKEHTLRSGHNPCFFEPLPGKREGGWGWVNTDYLTK